MNKLLKIFGTTILCLALYVGCSNKNNVSKKVDLNTLSEDVLTALEPQADLIEISEKVLSNYYNLNDKIVKSHKIYISSAWTAEEVAIFQLVDNKSSTIEAAQSMIKQRIDTLTTSFDGYLPEELITLQENSTIYQNGPIIAFISGSADGVASALTVLQTACEK